MLYAAWLADPFRATRDLDLLAFADRETAPLLDIFRDICAQTVADDGLRFDTENILAEPSSGDLTHGALRIRTSAQLAAAIIPMQIDVGFGDAVTPGPLELEYPFFSTTRRRPSMRIHATPWPPRSSKPSWRSTSRTAA